MNSKDIVKIQKAFSPTLYSTVKNKIFDNAFPWYYLDHTTEPNSKISSLTHMVMNDYESTSFICPMLETCIINMLDENNLKFNRLIRIRIGMLLQKTELIFNTPHVDQQFPHNSGLIYLTTCNAPTKLYDNFYNINFNTEHQVFETHSCIDSQENTAVVFDGLRYHSSSFPTDIDRRITINFNYE